jgi:hypothetical protein
MFLLAGPFVFGPAFLITQIIAGVIAGKYNPAMLLAIPVAAVSSAWAAGLFLTASWWSFVIAGFWQVTILPTVSEAIVFWSVVHAVLRWLPHLARSAKTWVLTLSAGAALTSLLVWLVFPLARSQFLEFTAPVVLTGAILGALIAAFPGRPPNSTRQSSVPPNNAFESGPPSASAQRER